MHIPFNSPSLKTAVQGEKTKLINSPEHKEERQFNTNKRKGIFSILQIIAWSFPAKVYMIDKSQRLDYGSSSIDVAHRCI